jgi:DNA-binding NtrC family response regulator
MPIALLFTDVVMPDMNGRRLAEEAQRRRPSMRVIFTTGFSRNAVIHNGVLDKDVNFLSKPFTLEQLTAKVREVLRGFTNQSIAIGTPARQEHCFRDWRTEDHFLCPGKS